MERNALSFYVIGIVTVFVYTNTLIGDFTFDDNFAVITNGDVTNDRNTLAGVFKHDFWGQNIASTQSHKSYRPVTILAFRWTRQAWDAVQLLLPNINEMVPRPPPLPQQLQQQDAQDAFNAKSPRPKGLHPFPFHVLSVLLHAVVSMLVLALAQHLFAILEIVTGTAITHAGSSSGSRSSAQDKHYSSTGSWGAGWLVCGSLQEVWLQPATKAGQQKAFIAALLFALHPIHTEAVAGVVGCAELICAAWSIPALLLFFMAVDRRYVAAQQLQHRNSSISSSSKFGFSSRNSAAAAATPAKTRQQRGRTASSAAASAVATTDPGAGWTQAHLADAVQHWLLVLAAAALALLAALSKEIGITVTGTMVLYDLLLAPHIVPLQSCSSSSSTNDTSSSNCSVNSARQKQQRMWVCRVRVLRILLLAAVTLGYIKLRSWVAVQQLVAIYRKVENPIPFARPFLTRLLTTGYLHARYFGLLVLPLHLSADWSFSCIPLVEQLSDTRNLVTLAVYAYLLYVGLSARPVQFLKELWMLACGVVPAIAGSDSRVSSAAASNRSGTGGYKSSTIDSVTSEAAKLPAAANASQLAAAAAAAKLGHARWRLLVVAGLLVAPYFPASNVLFYVGTFIGERLLYFPSIGFCLLVADLLGLLLQGQNEPQQQQQPGGPVQTAGLAAAVAAAASAGQPAQPTANKQDPAAAAADPVVSTGQSSLQPIPPTAKQEAGSSSSRSLGSAAVVVVVVLVCGGYAVRTVLRNADWWDEERLFMAAEQVCPNSAKVQQNCGVLQRRYHNFTAAMKHFRRAQEIEPSYCEPSYWIALTTINQGDVLRGLAAMKASLTCKYTSAEALQTLNKLYVMMHDSAPGDPMPMVEWAAVLASIDVLRIADGCSTAEDAAMLAASAGKSTNYIQQALDVCFEGIKAWEAGAVQPDTLASLARLKYSSLNSTLLRECVRMRRAVYKKLSGDSLKSATVRRALYKYINKVQQQYPGCRGLAGGGNVPNDGMDIGAHIPSSHQKLVHRVQSADPEDPWLQMEWGQTLIALGGHAALKDASMHMEVSSAIFSRIQLELQDPAAAAATASSSRSGSKQGHDERRLSAAYTMLDSKTAFTPETALEAAMLPLERFKSAAASSSDTTNTALYCEMLKRLCHLRLQMVVLVQQSNPNSDSNSNSGQGSVTAGLRQASSMKAVLNAKAAGRRCLVELSEHRGCDQQAEDIRRLVGRGAD